MARRSSRSGAAFAGAVAELAAQRRLALEDRAVAAAERAGVLISGPLGLCFLPAFLCLGIVPVVVGLASRVLSGGVL
jgi:pilus assembly protein TadC